jgi:hypothetical protein
VSLHCTLNEHNHHLINEFTIKQMRPGSTLFILFVLPFCLIFTNCLSFVCLCVCVCVHVCVPRNDCISCTTQLLYLLNFLRHAARAPPFLHKMQCISVFFGSSDIHISHKGCTEIQILSCGAKRLNKKSLTLGQTVNAHYASSFIVPLAAGTGSKFYIC